MTVWPARLAKRNRPGDTDRILCGWHAGTTYCAAPPIAWVIDAFSWSEPLIYLPMGLTDDGTFGVYRWAQGQRRRMQSGRSPLVARRGYLEEPLPCTVPCLKNHMSRIEIDLLVR